MMPARREKTETAAGDPRPDPWFFTQLRGSSAPPERGTSEAVVLFFKLGEENATV
jgi:hypothetical protein